MPNSVKMWISTFFGILILTILTSFWFSKMAPKIILPWLWFCNKMKHFNKGFNRKNMRQKQMIKIISNHANTHCSTLKFNVGCGTYLWSGNWGLLVRSNHLKVLSSNEEGIIPKFPTVDAGSKVYCISCPVESVHNPVQL